MNMNSLNSESVLILSSARRFGLGWVGLLCYLPSSAGGIVRGWGPWFSSPILAPFLSSPRRDYSNSTLFLLSHPSHSQPICPLQDLPFHGD